MDVCMYVCMAVAESPGGWQTAALATVKNFVVAGKGPGRGSCQKLGHGWQAADGFQRWLWPESLLAAATN